MNKLALLVIATQAAESATYNYKTNGADWPSLDIENNECGDAAQSPINLISKNSADFDYKILDARMDSF